MDTNGRNEEKGEYYDHGQWDQQQHSSKKFPPPIPFLAQTGNLQSRSPWVMKRGYINGRLVIKMVKVKEHHDYFQANRENGSLKLQLVYLSLENLFPVKQAATAAAAAAADDNEKVDQHEDIYQSPNSILK